MKIVRVSAIVFLLLTAEVGGVVRAAATFICSNLRIGAERSGSDSLSPDYTGRGNRHRRLLLFDPVLQGCQHDDLLGGPGTNDLFAWSK